MAERLEITEELSIPLGEIDVRTARSSGPGGQHANVTESRVEASFDVERSHTLDGVQRGLLLERLGPRVSAVAQDARGQARNRELALGRLAAKLAGALEVAPPRRPTRPGRAARERRVADKRRRGERKRERQRPPPDLD